MPRKPNVSKDNYYDPFPSALRALMKENNTKQEEIRSVLGLANRQSVTGYVDGSTAPTADKIIALSQYFDVSADFLLGISEHRCIEGGQRESAEYTGLSENAVEALHKFTTDFEGSLKGFIPALSAILTDEALLDLLEKFLSCIAHGKNLESIMTNPNTELYLDDLERESEFAEYGKYKTVKCFESILDRALDRVYPLSETIEKARSERQKAISAAIDEGWEGADDDE